MKYILLTILIILGCVGTGIVAGFNARHYYVNIKRYQCILIGVGVVVIEFGICFLSFIMSDYDAEREAYNYLNDSDTVDVSKEDYGYFFDGDGEKDAIIFYPGANVEIEAYAPLMYMLAEEGIDAFLISMPLKLPLFGKNKGEEIINKYSYESYYMAGHSLGGTMAAKFAASNNKVNGVIFLASYSTVKLDDSLKVLSMYGTRDRVMSMNDYNQNVGNFPKSYKEVVIEGGNHAGFGMYKNQRGDGDSKITTLTQIECTKEEIVALIRN